MSEHASPCFGSSGGQAPGEASVPASTGDPPSPVDASPPLPPVEDVEDVEDVESAPPTPLADELEPLPFSSSYAWSAQLAAINVVSGSSFAVVHPSLFARVVIF